MNVKRYVKDSIALFEDQRRPEVKECGQFLEAQKNKKIDSPVQSLGIKTATHNNATAILKVVFPVTWENEPIFKS